MSDINLVCVQCVGFVSWQEFHVHFLLAKGHKLNDTLQHVEDYDTLPIDSDGDPLKLFQFWTEENSNLKFAFTQCQLLRVVKADADWVQDKFIWVTVLFQWYMIYLYHWK